MANAMIIIESDDKLRREVWNFTLYETRLRLYAYHDEERKTRRHGFKKTLTWNRYEGWRVGGYRQKKDGDPTPSEEIVSKALEIIRNKIVYEYSAT